MKHPMSRRHGSRILAGAATMLVSLVAASSATAGTFGIGDQSQLTPGSQVTFGGTVVEIH